MNYQQKQLMDFIEKRIQTTMIGALARFEDSFGYLWEKETSNRQYFEQLWENTRNHILNNGNNQLRLTLDELENYFYNKPMRPKVEQKYHYKFYPKNNNGGSQK